MATQVMSQSSTGNAGNGGDKRPSRPSGQKGNRAHRDRCTRCILARKGCDGVKPVCGRCRRHPDRCVWPDGRPSRTQLLQMQAEQAEEEGEEEEEQGENNANEHEEVAAEGQGAAPEQEELRGADAAGVPLRGDVVYNGYVDDIDDGPEVLARGQPVPGDGNHLARRALSQSSELREEVRLRVLASTRAYLGQGPEEGVGGEEAEEAEDDDDDDDNDDDDEEL
ncbi:hypothetical protein HRR81_007419 [Exophiala dermatitidis]|uniref:Zn(2)-C6 fungal-type domain-containing protein n=2 Tax=Exophiala dermatitidis TaxID=5970 RepID=H6C4I3_EXODN|nr:uncharacterized protein HMPREF1120_06475 [Exophiala dermatitidis NIH/UT8656]KAJ4509152.1 hypothetical protein HRR75_006121 [Exophiala dermatitidis]EHY58465.1 hypothetical protein HMPREF1120_06475 [Exophiala dermatitidis NIH/UT8656]KAJ4545778.1 hypothetical protein HRR78_006052 [Exophiala dermatitidis]KAJ4566728.1 hypothetical protein HRR81_007419 [Exophiala dermatitidis]KAJ4675393.1 hypothetical protein HRR95_005478 [Exophiala dermatitidis]